MTHKLYLALLWFACIGVPACATTAFAADVNYPTHPLRVIVGFPPGSGTDMIARFAGNKLTERLGQQVVVDNRPGANGIIAAELVTKATPDGHTLLAMSISHTMNAAVYKLPFDAVKSFTPITQLGAVSRLHSEIAAILAQPESAKRLEAEGAVPSPLASIEYTRTLNTEIEKWIRVARDANIKAE